MSFKFCPLCIEILDVLQKLSLESAVSEKAHKPSSLVSGRLEQQIGHLRRKAILEKSKKYKEA